MKRFFILASFLLTVLTSHGQVVSIDSLKQYVDVLASDEMEGRATGTEGGFKAASYIASKMIELGLEPGPKASYMHPFKWRTRAFAQYSITVGKKIYRDGSEDYVGHRYFMSSEYNTPFIVRPWIDLQESERVAESTLTYRQIEQINNDIELFNTIHAMAKEAKKKGCSSLVIVHPNKTQYKRVRKVIGENGRTGSSNNIGIFHTIENRFLNALKDYKTGHTTNEYAGVESNNIIGQINPDAPGPCIVIGGHFDHEGKKLNTVYNGADDNASGIALLLSLITEVRKLKLNKRVVFVAFDAEERGLLGSKQLVMMNTLGQVDLLINLDMVGRMGKSNPSINMLAPDHVLKEVLPLLSNSQVFYDTSKNNHRSDKQRYFERSDHHPFAINNVDYISFLGRTHSDYHQPGDDIDKIIWEPMAVLGQDILAILLSLYVESSIN